jgi:PAS domain S-box-containing protein
MKTLSLTRRLGFRQTMLLIAGCFILVTLGVALVAIVSRHYSREGSRQTETLTGQFLPGLVTLSRLQAAALNLKSITFQFALAKDEAAMNAQKQAFQDCIAQVASNIAELKTIAHDGQADVLIASFGVDVQTYRESAEKFQEELRAGEFERAMAILDQQIDPAQEKIESQLRTLSEQYFLRSRDASARTSALLAQSDRFGFIATIVLAGFTLLCLGLSLAATRILLVQIQKRDAERLAAQATLEKRVDERTAELRASEERVRLIVDTASDAIITTDPAGTITAWNRQAETTFGWPQAEAIGRNFAQTLISTRHREAHVQRLERFLSAGDVAALNQRIEINALHRDGHELPVELVITPVRLGETVLFSAFLHDITERKRVEAELKQMHRQFIETSRQAGMAEVATGVLHNVGNALNSVNVSATLVSDQLAKSKSANLTKISAMLEERKADVVNFLTNDPKGIRIPGYLATLAVDLAAEQQAATNELDHLRKNIEHIKDIVSMQQSYAKVSGVTEQVSISSLVEDALRMNASALVRHGLEVVRDFQADPTVTVERHKVLQVLVNLIRNAKYACDDSGRPDKKMIVRIQQTNDRIQLAVIDNGVGIPPENLTRIFAHGFTTRKDGHGFGLHSGALVAKELGGSLSVQSGGPGLGAAFILEIPFKSNPVTA